MSAEDRGARIVAILVIPEEAGIQVLSKSSLLDSDFAGIWNFYICPPFPREMPRFVRQGVLASSYHTPCGPPCQGGQNSGLRPRRARTTPAATGRGFSPPYEGGEQN